jgi:hypothetical protein
MVLVKVKIQGRIYEMQIPKKDLAKLFFAQD